MTELKGKSFKYVNDEFYDGAMRALKAGEEFTVEFDFHISSRIGQEFPVSFCCGELVGDEPEFLQSYLSNKFKELMAEAAKAGYDVFFRHHVWYFADFCQHQD